MAGAAGCPHPQAVGEAGVGCAQPGALLILKHHLLLEVKDWPVEGAAVDAGRHLQPECLLGSSS